MKLSDKIQIGDICIYSSKKLAYSSLPIKYEGEECEIIHIYKPDMNMYVQFKNGEKRLCLSDELKLIKRPKIIRKYSISGIQRFNQRK